jgi:beta-N-acetylhexosaminidase
MKLRPWQSVPRLTRELVSWALPLLALIFAANHRAPLLFKLRYPVFFALCLLAAIVVWRCRSWIRRWRDQPSRLTRVLVVLLAAGLATGQEAAFRLTRHRVLDADPSLLRLAGRQIVVGYTDFDEIKELAARGAVAGVFVTTRNVAGEGGGRRLRAELEQLQALRKAKHLPPLIVAADQEGGAVSRLSPPLSALPPLASVVHGEPDAVRRMRRVQEYARVHGAELSTLGVNVNFGPVVDLRLQHRRGSVDLYSKIADRAISRDAGVVTDTALTYARSLRQHGVWPTLKHFPGLGRVAADTHFFTAELDLSSTELAAEDWLPFRRVSERVDALIMLAHVKLPRVDSEQLASCSKPVVTGILRAKWRYQGLLITDDFCMLPVWNEGGGFERNIVRSLNAGVDLILIAADVEQVYPALDALLDGLRDGVLDPDTLKKSRRRLDAALARMSR